MAKKRIRCSFCGKEERDVRQLYYHDMESRAGVCICDECVLLCHEIVIDKSAGDKSKAASETVDFREMTPTKIKAYLDKHIIGQERAKVTMAVAIYNHYKRINAAEQEEEDEDVHLGKGNILMAGPTGCGKTLIASTIANLLNVPFVVADATTLTEAGYVGEDVENIIKNLWIAADRSVERTEKGIVCVDEVDKIATRQGSTSSGRDVGGEGVQQALLKMIESGVVQIPVDPAKNRPQSDLVQINTSNILFIFTGAFNNLSQIVQTRIGRGTMGFSGKIEKKEADSDKLLKQVEAEDFIKFGLIPEFMGRIPIIVTLEDLSESDLLEVLWKPKNSVLTQYEKLFAIDNVKLVVTESGREAIVREAIKRKSGARGLRSIFEEVMLDIMYEIPSMDNVHEVTIDADVVEGKQKAQVSYFKDAS